MKHCMLDLETWGTAPGSALRSIGAVMFELDGQIGPKCYANIATAPQEGKLDFDQKTIDWWNDQRDEAKGLLEGDQRHPAEVIDMFHQGFIANGGRYLWGNGANFDPVLWESFCRAFDQKVPWGFWNVRCCRTWCAAHDFNAKSVSFVGVKHYALDDCLHQIKYVVKAGQKSIISQEVDREEVNRLVASQPNGNTFTMGGK